MRCHICDVSLSENEIQFNRDHKDFNPCGKCLEIIDNVFEPLDDDAEQKALEETVEEEPLELFP